MIGRVLARAAGFALQHSQGSQFVTAARPLLACFSVVGPSKTKTYNLENQLKPFTLNNLWNVPGARKKKKILGRGPGCKHGKLSGRGMKGQGQRGSKKHPKFEGNNKELYLRLPKFGLKKSAHRFETVNLDKVLYAIEKGWLNPAELITIRALKEAAVVKSPKFGVKLLCRGVQTLSMPLKFEVSAASDIVINTVKAAGGEITIKYRTPLKLREHLHPHKYPVPLGEPVAPQSEARRLEKYRSKGVKLEYSMPEWVAKLVAEDKSIEMENKVLQRELGIEFPVNRYPGMGKDRVRKRKMPMARQFKFKLNSDDAGKEETA